ncbi:MAG TPA: TetR/AcrR family transcriptional regulator [Caulobacteraceae bacterium]|nr:TetR/AcrR family transcriptional regulator [Caulobacteraceae bacterium]
MPRALSAAQIEDFRDRLIEAAERLFVENGPGAVSMRQLAAELGVSPMTPYRYFKDKNDILAAARASGFDRFAEALETAFDAGDDPIQRASNVSKAYVKFAFEHPDAYRLMFDLAQPTETDYPDLVRAASRARATMSHYTQGLLDIGVLKGDPETIAYVYWAAVHGLVVLKLADKLPPDRSFDELWSEMSRALNAGFRP